MKTSSTDLLNLTVTDSTRRSWLLPFWIVGCLLATSFCVFKGLEASSTTKPTTRQTTVTKEVRRQTRMDEIKEGDVVLARDEFGETVAPKKVTRVFRRTSDHLRLLTFESRDGTRQTIKTTDEHPFALSDSLDFVRAGDLAVGTEVPGPKGERQTLVASTREDHAEGIPVFNFEVEGFHTYFVSTRASHSSLLVHNRCDFTNELRLDVDQQRALMRQRLGSQGTGSHAHHLIPLEMSKTHPDLLQRAARGGFDINGANNGVALRPWVEHGPPPWYNDACRRTLDDLEFQLRGATDADVASALQSLADHARHAINNGFTPNF